MEPRPVVVKKVEGVASVGHCLVSRSWKGISRYA